jgi:Zn-finger nucleic acid-binding protein
MCPVCNEPMLVYQMRGAEVDRCDRCGGSWLDAGELEIAGRIGEPGDDALAAAIYGASDSGRTSRKCPRCRKRLVEARVEVDPAVVLDHCPRCRGLWFDRGEMEHLIAAFRGSSSPTARFIVDMHVADAPGGASDRKGRVE